MHLIGICTVPVLYLSIKIAPSHGGCEPPYNTWFLLLTRILKPHGISIGSAVFVSVFINVTDRQTDRQTILLGLYCDAT